MTDMVAVGDLLLTPTDGVWTTDAILDLVDPKLLCLLLNAADGRLRALRVGELMVGLGNGLFVHVVTSPPPCRSQHG